MKSGKVIHSFQSVFAMSWHDYESELSDTGTPLDFGKYTGLTPEQVLSKDPGWLVWCWTKTHRWCGSEDLLRDAFDETGKVFVPRTPNEVLPPAGSIEDFEAAILEAYGAFPKPHWAHW